MWRGTLKEIRRRAVSAPTDGFSEEISSHYLFIDRLDSFNLSEPGGLFCRFNSYSLHILMCWYANHIINRRPKRRSERDNFWHNLLRVLILRDGNIFHKGLSKLQYKTNNVMSLLHTSFQLYQSSLAVQKNWKGDRGGAGDLCSAPGLASRD